MIVACPVLGSLSTALIVGSGANSQRRRQFGGEGVNGRGFGSARIIVPTPRGYANKAAGNLGVMEYGKTLAMELNVVRSGV